jgi:type I restriction enzyme R subunit
MSGYLDEDAVEQYAIGVFQSLGYGYVHGSTLSPGTTTGERASFRDSVLAERLRSALERLNPSISSDEVDGVIRKVTILSTTDMLANNQQFHKYLVEGFPYECRDEHHNLRTNYARLLDFENSENNDWLAVNQYTVKEDKRPRRPDVVIFVNGLPLGLIEFKNPTDENATIESAYNQLQTYKDEIPGFCAFNELMVVSDGVEARLGTLTADYSRFLPWKSIETADISEPEFVTLARGVFEKSTFLDIVRYFILFESDGKDTSKKVAGYHQYRATNLAVSKTLEATAAAGNRHIGVVWHTQGSGKSLTMVFYAGKIIQQPELENPTLVVITDRNDLDGQLFGQFARCKEILRQEAVQAESREDLKSHLSVVSGGIVFTTIQKFYPDKGEDVYPVLTDRRNVIVIADEAHRSQYDTLDGFARHMRDALPNASFIGFTGTPIETGDKNTRQVFGDYIDTYDIAQAVADGATVPIYYEPRIAKLDLKADQIPKIDPDLEEIVAGESADRVQKLKSKWAKVEAIVGSKGRLAKISADLVQHFETRSSLLEGKGMIVAMSRQIASDLYEAIGLIRPEWLSDDEQQGKIKVVMSSSADDPSQYKKHARSRAALKNIEKRFKDVEDGLQLVIVCDMWLTGFDLPSLHTMYFDKPMHGHSLMQAIARVNRVYKDKPGGLIVDYIALAPELKAALKTYTVSGGKGKPFLDETETIPALTTKYEIVRDMFHGFNYKALLIAPVPEKLAGLIAAADFVLGLEDGRDRYLDNTYALIQAYALSSTSDYASSIRDDVKFFDAIRAKIAKARGASTKSNAQMDTAVRQLIGEAVVSEGIIDILAETGVKKPDVSVLSDEFLAEVKDIPQKNLAREMLEKLLRDEIRRRAERNAVRSKKFSDMLSEAIQKYKNKSIETAGLIGLLIDIAKEIKQEDTRNKDLNLTEDEIAFYDALAQSNSAVEVLGDKQLRIIAAELVKAVKQNVSLDWTLRETAKANIRRIIRRILNKFGYPPEVEEKAVETVLTQAELLCAIEAA